MFLLLSAVSASLGPAAVPDTVKTRQQLTFVCLRRFRFLVAVWFWVLKTWKRKSGWMEQNDSTRRYP
jgi:uncharacterized membrane protein YbhN (UPF0104 family)